MRCTQATLTAIGITGIAPVTGLGVLSALTAHGRRWAAMDLEGFASWRSGAPGKPGTVGLADFIAANPTGTFYIASTGHAMALVNGRLTDTARMVVSNRVRLWSAIKILS